MTLDDFFTSTEMNNGLTDSFRVRELVAVMQNGNDCHVKNVGDSIRQWSAVASAIAATDNKDSLDLFIQLDGLKFLGMWLEDAQKFSNNTSDSSVGESITNFLRALEKLHVDYEKLVASGIWTTIKVLLVHNNSNVQDKARELYESWKRKTDGETSLSNVEKNGPSSDHEVGRTEDTERGSEHSEGSTSVQVKEQESKSDGPVLAVSSDAEAVQSMAKSLDPPSGNERPLDHVDSHSSAIPSVKTPVFNSTVGTTVDSFSPAFSGQNALHPVSPSDIKHTAKVENSVEKVSLEESNVSREKTVTSCSDAAGAIISESKSSSQIFTSNVDKSSCEECPLNDNSRSTDSKGKSTMDYNGYVYQPRSSNVFSAKAAGDFKHHMMRISHSSEKSLRSPMDIEIFLSGTDNVGTINKNLQMGDTDLANNYIFYNDEMDKGSHQGGKNSDVELDYGILDPLELARQVAIEVEREVVDYKEQSCSSSDKLPRGNTRQTDGPDTVNAKQSSASKSSVEDMENDPDSSGEEDSPMRQDSITSFKTLDANQKNVTPDVESSQVTEAVRAEAEKDVGNFDLNLEICSEDIDQPANQFLAPVSIVAASKAKTAPGQPTGPLKFEGNLGWKGSAATSAFRPASACRMLESEKDLSAGGSSSSSKPQQLCLEFDLNVAESVGESSVATNSRKYEHLELDLNHASEDAGSSEWQIGQQFFPQQNDHQSHSHSSSSSSKHPSLRNIDLNGQPSFLNDSYDRSYLTKLSQNHNVSGGVKSDDSVISIMGTRVQVNRKDFFSQTMPLLNGQTPELAFDLNLGRSGNFLGVGSVVPYTHFPLNGYNHIAPGPTMPSTPNLYGSGGPIPYMVDSRGAPVIPQLVGSVSALPTSLVQPPFVINMSGSSPSNEAGPSRSTFELNSGMMLESGSGEPVGFRQFLSTGHVRSMDEQQLKFNAQSPVSLVGGKRKEPENGWEQYSFRSYEPHWK